MCSTARTPTPLGPLRRTAGTEIKSEFDDLQIDAHGFAAFRRHKFACFPFLSANFPPNEFILIHGLGRREIVEEERPIFDLKGYWKVRALCYGVLELANANITPRAALGKGGDAKRSAGIQDARELLGRQAVDSQSLR